MIRMVDSDGDGQVSWDEFYSMVTGGKKAPAGLGVEAKGGAAAAKSGAPPPPTGQNVVQARNAKKAALEEFAKENNLKPESIKKAYKRFQATDKDKSGVVDYTEFCEILQVDPAPLCETVFRLYDYDKTGQIDAREFLIAVSNYTGAGKEDKLKFAFMSFDEDGNGVITKAELLKILKVSYTLALTHHSPLLYTLHRIIYTSHYSRTTWRVTTRRWQEKQIRLWRKRTRMEMVLLHSTSSLLSAKSSPTSW